MESLILSGPTNLKNDFSWSTFMVEVQVAIMGYELQQIFKNFPLPGSPAWDIFWNRVEEIMVSNLALQPRVRQTEL